MGTGERTWVRLIGFQLLPNKKLGHAKIMACQKFGHAKVGARN
jgi:hypothetical protein